MEDTFKLEHSWDQQSNNSFRISQRTRLLLFLGAYWFLGRKTIYALSGRRCQEMGMRVMFPCRYLHLIETLKPWGFRHPEQSSEEKINEMSSILKLGDKET